MIFSKYRTIIFINKERIQWAKGQVPKGRIFSGAKILSWSEDNLRAAFLDIEKKFPQHLRIVVGEEFSYVTRFQKNGEKRQIEDEIQTLIPENMQDGWDSREGKSGTIQVMALQQNFLLILKKVLAETKLRVEVIETESIAISRLIPVEKDKTVLFARYGEKIIMGAIQDNIVLATKIFSDFFSAQKAKEFLDYVSSRKKFSFGKIYIQDEKGKLRDIFRLFKLEIQEKELDPMVGICQKKDIHGRDKDVLNIQFKKSGKVKSKEAGKKHLLTRERVLLFVFIIVVISGAATVYYINKSRQNRAETKRIIQTVPIGQPGLMWGK